jgi:hypothetical protein
MEDIVQMLDFTPPPSDKKKKGGRDDDDGAPPNEGDEDSEYKEVRNHYGTLVGNSFRLRYNFGMQWQSY